jgi:hypothetical protein
MPKKPPLKPDLVIVARDTGTGQDTADGTAKLPIPLSQAMHMVLEACPQLIRRPDGPAFRESPQLASQVEQHPPEHGSALPPEDGKQERTPASRIRQPPTEAFAAYRTWLATGMNQTELAERLRRELKRPVHQGTVFFLYWMRLLHSPWS